MGKARAERVAARREWKALKRAQRFDFKEVKQETKGIAYAQGFSPGAKFVDALGNAVGAVGGVVGTAMTGIPMTGNATYDRSDVVFGNQAAGGLIGSSGPGMIVWVVGGFLLLMMIMKK